MKIKLGLILVLAIGLTAALVLVGQKNLLQKQASGNDATISLITDNASLRDNDQANVAIFLDPKGQNVVYVKIALKYDASKLVFNGFSGFDPNLRVVANENGTFIGIVERPNNPISAPVQLAKANFSMAEGVDQVFDTSVKIGSTSEIVAVPAQIISYTSADLNLKVNGKETVLKDLGLQVDPKEAGGQKSLALSWKTVTNKNLVRYRAVVINAAGEKVNSEPGGISKTLTSTVINGTNLQSGNYTVVFSAIFPDQVWKETQNFQVSEDNKISLQ